MEFYNLTERWFLNPQILFGIITFRCRAASCWPVQGVCEFVTGQWSLVAIFLWILQIKEIASYFYVLSDSSLSWRSATNLWYLTNKFMIIGRVLSVVLIPLGRYWYRLLPCHGIMHIGRGWTFIMMTTCVARRRRRRLWLNDMEEADLDFGRWDFNGRTRVKDKLGHGRSQQQLNHVQR